MPRKKKNKYTRTKMFSLKTYLRTSIYFKTHLGPRYIYPLSMMVSFDEVVGTVGFRS